LAGSLVPSQAAPAQWPVAVAPPQSDAALEARVQAIVAGMTLEQKVGQMTQPDIPSVTPDDVRKY
jgi:beta-glucosidase